MSDPFVQEMPPAGHLARLDRLPLSRPHILIAIVCGFGLAFDAMDGAVVAFSIPSLREEWGISLGQAGYIGAITQAGLAVGLILSGYLGDRFGRRLLMMYALVLYCVFTVIGAFATDFEFFLAVRFLAGIGIGAEATIIVIFVAEFMPAAKRGIMVGLTTAFFALGTLFASLLGRFVIAESENGWRIANLIAAAPVVMVLVFRRFLPESPRYLLRVGRTAEAERVVSRFERKVEQATGRALPPVQVEGVRAATHAEDVQDLKGLAGYGLVFGRLFKVTMVVSLLWITYQVVSQGFNTFIPTLLIERGLTIQTSFTYSIAILGAQVPGYLFGAWVSEHIDRKRAVVLGFTGSALAAGLLSQAPNDVVLIAGGMLLSFFIAGSFAVIFTYTPELFPTWARATGTGIASAFGRAGSIASLLLIGGLAERVGFGGIFAGFFALLAVAAILTMVMSRSTARRPLEEISAEAGVPDAPAAILGEQPTPSGGTPAPGVAPGDPRPS